MTNATFRKAARRLPEALDLDQAAGTARILGDELREPRGGLELVEEPARQPAMQRAHGLRVLAGRLAVRTVAQPIGDSSGLPRLSLRRKTQRNERAAHRRRRVRVASAVKELPADLAPRALDLAQAGWAGRDAAREPSREPAVGVGRLPTAPRVGCDRPAVARPATRPGLSLALDEPGFLQALEMDSNTAGMKAELGGELIGSGGPREARQTREQPGTGGLSEEVARAL
jgi:hypothetical protein